MILCKEQYWECHSNTADSNIGRLSFADPCALPESSKQSEKI